MSKNDWTCVSVASSSIVNQASVANNASVRNDIGTGCTPCARQADQTTGHTAGQAKSPEHLEYQHRLHHPEPAEYLGQIGPHA